VLGFGPVVGLRRLLTAIPAMVTFRKSLPIWWSPCEYLVLCVVVRERIGSPARGRATARTVADWSTELRAREERYAVAFSSRWAFGGSGSALTIFDASLECVRRSGLFSRDEGG